MLPILKLLHIHQHWEMTISQTCKFSNHYWTLYASKINISIQKLQILHSDTVEMYDDKRALFGARVSECLGFVVRFWPNCWPDFRPGVWSRFWGGEFGWTQCTVLPGPQGKNLGRNIRHLRIWGCRLLIVGVLIVYFDHNNIEDNHAKRKKLWMRALGYLAGEVRVGQAWTAQGEAVHHGLRELEWDISQRQTHRFSQILRAEGPHPTVHVGHFAPRVAEQKAPSLKGPFKMLW